jgi:hypothetical protein
MNWLRQVQNRIARLIAQNRGQKTEYTYPEEKQKIIGVTEHFTVYNTIDEKLFIRMPGLSMYITVGEAKALRDLLSDSIKDK